jgi:hypothetical protein
MIGLNIGLGWGRGGGGTVGGDPVLDSIKVVKVP